MKTRNLVMVLSAMLALNSCYNDNKEELYQNQPSEVICDTSNINHTDTIQAILATNCGTAGCHSAQSLQSGLNLEAYTDAATIANDGRLVGRITGSSGPIMPPSGQLPACEIEKLTKWANDGAPEN